MDIIEAIKSRHSVRAFKPQPVSQIVLKEILSVSTRSPSWANTQTWEFAVAGGDVMQELCKKLAERALAQDERIPDIPRPEWPSPYRERRNENGGRLYDLMGIKRDDIEAQLYWFVDMYRFFGAPSAIFIYTDRNLSSWAMLNIGLVTQTICLAALAYGLGTVILAAGVSYPDTVRSILKIPDNKQIVIALAIGYPDEKAKVNSFRSNRVPLDEICTWHGFNTTQ